MESGIDEIAIMSARPHGHISVVFSSSIPLYYHGNIHYIM